MTAVTLCPDCGNPTRSHTGTASANDNGEIVACPLTREHAERLAMVGEFEEVLRACDTINRWAEIGAVPLGQAWDINSVLQARIDDLLKRARAK